jgi:hypothetical protein
LPLEIHQDYYRLNNEKALVPVTIQFPNRELAFEEEERVYIARIAVYGLVTSLSNRVITEFEDDLLTAYSPEKLDIGLQESSVYQKILALDLKNRYKLDLIIKDVKSNKVGAVKTALIPPAFDQDTLQTSSLVLSTYIKQLSEAPDEIEMFVLGDIKVRPSVKREFVSGSLLGVYLQAYNFLIDQTTQMPSLRIAYSISHKGDLVFESVDENGETIQFFSGQRAVIIEAFSLEGCSPGHYTLKIEITDNLSEKSTEVEGDFVVLKTRQIASK